MQRNLIIPILTVSQTSVKQKITKTSVTDHGKTITQTWKQNNICAGKITITWNPNTYVVKSKRPWTKNWKHTHCAGRTSRQLEIHSLQRDARSGDPQSESVLSCGKMDGNEKERIKERQQLSYIKFMIFIALFSKIIF